MAGRERKTEYELRTPADGLNGKQTMKIELELPNMTARRLRDICRQICTSHKSTPRFGDGRSTIYGLTKRDIEIVESLIHAITASETDNSIPRFLQKYNV